MGPYGSVAAGQWPISAITEGAANAHWRLQLIVRVICVILVSGVGYSQIAFEVASIRPSPPVEFGRTSVRRSVDKEKGTEGRLNYQGISLLDLIADANHIQHRQISGPDWLSSQRFDILAVIPASQPEDQIPEMIGALLLDRFNLKTHDETKEMQVYGLVVAKGGPKLKRAEQATGISGKSTKTTEHVSARTTLAGLAAYLSERLDRPWLIRPVLLKHITSNWNGPRIRPSQPVTNLGVLPFSLPFRNSSDCGWRPRKQRFDYWSWIT